MILTVVTGPPCSGKTTYVERRRRAGDIVVDLDAIAVALGYSFDHVDWTDDPRSPVVDLALDVHRVLVGALLNREPFVKLPPSTRAVWVIDSDPIAWRLAKYRARGAEVVELDPGRASCRARAVEDRRPASTFEQIDAWYADRAPASPATEFFESAAPPPAEIGRAHV